MRILYVAALLLVAPIALGATDDPDAEFNQRLVESARKVIFDYKLYRRYSDEKFTPDARLAEINDRVTDEDVTQDEMVSLRQESWALNGADFNLNIARKNFRERLGKAITAYKDIREQSKSDPALKLSKDDEAVLIKAELVVKSPETLTHDVSLPSDKARKPKPKEAAAAAPGPAKNTSAATANGPKADPGQPAANAADKKVDASMVTALAKYNTIIVGKVHGVLARRDIPAGDDRKWQVVVDIKEVLRGKPIPGNAVSVYITSPTENFSAYDSVEALKNRPVIYALNYKDGVVSDAEAPFPLQKFDKDDMEKLRSAFKE